LTESVAALVIIRNAKFVEKHCRQKLNVISMYIIMSSVQRRMTTIRLSQKDEENIALVGRKTRLTSTTAIICMALQREADRLVAQENQRVVRHRVRGRRRRVDEPSGESPAPANDAAKTDP
jgi:hypothetical protein